MPRTGDKSAKIARSTSRGASGGKACVFKISKSVFLTMTKLYRRNAHFVNRGFFAVAQKSTSSDPTPSDDSYSPQRTQSIESHFFALFVFFVVNKKSTYIILIPALIMGRNDLRVIAV